MTKVRPHDAQDSDASLYRLRALLAPMHSYGYGCPPAGEGRMNQAQVERIVRAIPSVPALADQLAARSARLDALAAAKLPLPEGERIIVAAMRVEFRRRTGERI